MVPVWRRMSKSTVFTLLMMVGVLGALLPMQWTSWMGMVFQPVAMVKLFFLSSSHAVTGGGAPRPADSAQLNPEALWRENEELKRLVAHQSLQIDQLEKNLRTAMRIQEELHDSRARLIIALVVGHDASPKGATIEISRGTRDGVSLGDWVAAAPPESDDDNSEGKVSGYERLMRQSLIGKVQDVLQYTARVRLTTDPAVGPLQVRLAKTLPSGSLRFHEDQPLLYGRGDGLMEIREAKQKFDKLGYDLVLTDVAGGRNGILLGRVTDSRAMAASALHFNLDVKPLIEPRALARVYVISRPDSKP